MKVGYKWKQWTLNLCQHACLHTDDHSNPSHIQLSLSWTKPDCSVLSVERQMRRHPLWCVFLHHWNYTIPSRFDGGGGGRLITRRASGACISATQLTSFPHLGSKEEQRATEARQVFKSNTGYSGLLETGQRPDWEVFPAWSVLRYRFIPCAAECCALCHIKGTGPREWQNPGAVEKNVLL